LSVALRYNNDYKTRVEINFKDYKSLRIRHLVCNMKRKSEIKRKRDFSFALAVKSKQSNDWFKYKELRNLFQKQSRIKLIDFFARKTINDFNESKKSLDVL
jgi:hypothetical protein